MGIFSHFHNAFHGSNHADTSAIILCAGNSTRFSNDNVNKQLYRINNKSVIERTIVAFEKAESINEIVLVVKKEETAMYNRLICDNAYRKVSCIVVGGETRQLSAMRGFKHVSEKTSYVAFHDGARCLVTPQMIDLVANEARINHAATAATKVTDTVKLADDNGYISKTVDRELIWTVQTPQIFEKEFYRVCIDNAKQKCITATDDCMLAEAYGQKVKLVETGKDNIKITYKQDVLLAEAILKARGDK